MNTTRTASAVSRQAAPRVAAVSRVLPARARSVAVQAAPPKKVGGHLQCVQRCCSTLRYQTPEQLNHACMHYNSQIRVQGPQPCWREKYVPCHKDFGDRHNCLTEKFCVLLIVLENLVLQVERIEPTAGQTLAPPGLSVSKPQTSSVWIIDFCFRFDTDQYSTQRKIHSLLLPKSLTEPTFRPNMLEIGLKQSKNVFFWRIFKTRAKFSPNLPQILESS